MTHPAISRTIVRAALLAVALASNSWAGKHLPAGPNERVAPGELLVKVEDGAAGDALLDKHAPGAVRSRLSKRGLFRLRMQSGVTEAQARALAEVPGVEYVEPNRLRETQLLPPNDPRYSGQWNLTMVRALQAWSMIPARYGVRPGRVKVAVLDTGADCTHPDFKNGGSSVYSEQGGQMSQGFSSAFAPTTLTACAWNDDHGHGTHVAGIVAASTNNSQYVSSLGYSLELIVYKVLDAQGVGNDAGIAAAIMAAADAGARVVSMSLGSYGYSQTLQDAIDYAWERDVAVVVAACNNASDAMYFPAGANHTITVAAVDSKGVRAAFSNFGPYVDIAAPGVGIVSTYPVSKGSYTSMSGTSMATPHVAALAGLLAAATPGLSAGSITQRIQRSASASAASWDRYLGYGVINAAAALAGTVRATANTGAITGQVVDRYGSPVATTLSAAGITVTTDATGLFRIAPVYPGSHILSAGSTSVRVQVLAGSDTQITVTTGVAMAALIGSVSDASGTVSEGSVQLLQNGLIKAESALGAYGEYSVSAPAGTYDIRISSPGHVTTTVRGQTISGTVTRNLSIVSLGTIKGTVRNAAGTALAGVDVTVDGPTAAGAITDAAGNFETLGIQGGTYTVSASKAGFTPASVTNVTVSNGVASTVDVNLGASSIKVAITPAGPVTVAAGGTNQFTATVTAAPTQKVTWTVSPAVGTVASTGLYTAPSSVTAAQAIKVTAASVDDPSATASVTVNVVPLNLTLTIPSTQVQGGTKADNNTVTLATPAPPGGAVVTLASSNPAVASVPASVAVAAGSSVSAVFSITAATVAAAANVNISATYSGVTRTQAVTVLPAALSSVILSPATLTAGGSSSANQVILTGPAPSGGLQVALSTSDSVAAVPSTVAVAAGASSAVFPVTAGSVTADKQITISAVLSGVTRTAALTVSPVSAKPARVTVASSMVSGGESSSNSVTLSSPAPAGGMVVTLSSSNQVVKVPTSVTVAAGATAAPFRMTASPVAGAVSATITATAVGSTVSAQTSVRPAALSAVALGSATVSAGTAVTSNSVMLDGLAGGSGAVVSLTSSDASVSVPATITVPAGSSSAPFSIVVGAGVQSATVTISASYAGVVKTATASVSSQVASAVSFVVSVDYSVYGGKTANGYVKLASAAPSGGLTFALASSNPTLAQTPASVSVPEGQIAGYFQISTVGVSNPYTITITASRMGVTKSDTLRLAAYRMLWVTMPSTATAPGTIVGNSVTLNGPAGFEGSLVVLTSSDPTVLEVPATVLVPPGQTTATFTAVAKRPGAATISGANGGVTRSKLVTVY